MTLLIIFISTPSRPTPHIHLHSPSFMSSFPVWFAQILADVKLAIGAPALKRTESISPQKLLTANSSSVGVESLHPFQFHDGVLTDLMQDLVTTTLYHAPKTLYYLVLFSLWLVQSFHPLFYDGVWAFGCGIYAGVLIPVCLCVPSVYITPTPNCPVAMQITLNNLWRILYILAYVTPLSTAFWKLSNSNCYTLLPSHLLPLPFSCPPCYSEISPPLCVHRFTHCEHPAYHLRAANLPNKFKLLFAPCFQTLALVFLLVLALGA